jgi:hypothetical protein
MGVVQTIKDGLRPDLDDGYSTDGKPHGFGGGYRIDRTRYSRQIVWTSRG